ncbi:MAG: response regulator transcription factor [Candidatus Gastranaerophilales bacterium]|nr:response regulator transcription factor [Candidatus Gastranaerophilales bacterium]
MENEKCEKIRILIADDHKLIRVGLKNSLEKNNDMIVIAEAESGREAIQKFKTHKIDVAIVDLVLGDISGVEVIKQMNEINPDSSTIALSSQLKEQDVLNCMRFGALAYVLKDISSDILNMIVRTVNNGSLWLDSRAVSALKYAKNSILPQKVSSRASFRARHNNLTEREFEVLKLVVDGKSNFEIAEELNISEHTSKAHVCSIIQKLVVDDRTQAAVKAVKEGLV